jgi:branched-chain amino acid transport system ATP-binding protein
MTVHENLEPGAFLRNDSEEIASDLERADVFPAAAGTGSRRRRHDVRRRAADAGRRPGNDGLAEAAAARRPSMGLAPVLVDVIFETIERIREQGITVLLVEQNALAALRIADYAYVLESGSLKLEGEASTMAQDDEVVRAYLGG